MKYQPVQTKSVLVTGCSSGIGAAAAILLRDRGWNVLPTARKEADLQALREQGFEPVHLDVADSESVNRAADETLERLGGRLGGVVNNAGFGQAGALEDVSRDALRYQFEVNLFGMQELTNRFIPVFRKQAYGRIVNVSSVVGRVCLPFFGAYSSTKFAMEALSDAMRIELRGSGIAVSLVEPGPIATDFGVNSKLHVDGKLRMKGSHYENAYQKYINRIPVPGKRGFFTRPPEDVGKKIVHALESPRPRIRYCITIPAHVGAWMSRLAPYAFIDGVMAMRWERRIGPTS